MPLRANFTLLTTACLAAAIEARRASSQTVGRLHQHEPSGCHLTTVVEGEPSKSMIASIASRVMAMTAISIRNLDSDVKARLRIRAAEHGRSMEAEIRAILADAVAERQPVGLFDAIRAVSLEHGGVDLELPRRKRRQRPVELR
jgi:plasmid stability protein